MADVSIALKLQDNFSQAILGVKNAVTPFRKDLGAMNKELNMLRDTKVAFTIDLDKAKSEVKETRKAFKSLGDTALEADRAAAQADFSKALTNYENIRQQLSLISKQYKETERDMLDATDAITKADNRAGRAGGNVSGSQATGMLSALGKAGLIQMGGDVASQWANILVGSSFGQQTGSYFSGALSGAASGAAMGSLMGPAGTVIGGLAGGLIGTAGAAGQVYEQKNEAFKAYVQEQTQAQMNAMYEDISSGSGIAAKRESDAIAFNTLLGQGRGDQYLTDLRAMAAKTPMEYDDLTGMSRALATGFKDDTQRMLGLMTSIGNAGSAVGIDTDGMTEMAKAMSRMQSSGKASLEYLNIFQERGVDAVGMLATHLGKSKEQIYELISKGKIGGLDAVNAIQTGMDQMYAGAMEKQSQTFAGLSSTLADAQAEMQNAYGSGFNETRKKGLQDEIDFLSGESGALIQQANEAMGKFQASLENSKEEYVRKAMQAVIEDGDYQAALATGTDEGYAEAGRMLMEAKVRGMNEYNESSGAQLMVEMEKQLAGAIRENTQSNEAYWNAGYVKGQQYSLGFSAGANAVKNTTTSRLEMEGGAPPGKSGAYGFRRIPYNGFQALLHEGERVLTASEARSYDNSRSVQVQVSGNEWHVRQQSDIDAILNGIADRVELAIMGGAGP